MKHFLPKSFVYEVGSYEITVTTQRNGLICFAVIDSVHFSATWVGGAAHVQIIAKHAQDGEVHKPLPGMPPELLAALCKAQELHNSKA